jgi:aspartyl-tRNA(Asn)/glutamyl-tRNA(Gln) amidotransferase subunit B
MPKQQQALEEFEAVIGLEIHAQISTKTKMFCGCDNDSFRKKANTNICPICMGFPGMLPVPNKEAVEKGVKSALALNCTIPAFSKFDRKNYFYPDLTNGFQISQFDEPISEGGYVDIILNESEEDGGDSNKPTKKRIGVTRLHLENDAGKLTHTANGTLLDFNRAGTPLMEIVSEPEMHSSAEAKEYAETVQKILRYCSSSDCDMEKGMMRFDASVSIRPAGEDKLYPRGEIKNLNSFRALQAAIDYEIARQIELRKQGNPISNDQTLGWDDAKQETRVLREKESSADYRYFPEPDIPPVKITPEQITEWQKEVAELPMEKYERFLSEFKLPEQEARFYTESIVLANFFEEVAKATGNAKAASSFLGTILLKRLADEGLTLQDSRITAAHIIELIKLIDAGTISNNAAKTDIFDEMMKSGQMPAKIVEEKGLAQVSDTSAIEGMCQKAIDANPSIVADIRGGKDKAMGALVGFVMKESRGQANPKMVSDTLKKLLAG